MGKYDVIRQGSVNLVYPDKWATAMEVYDNEMERFDEREVRAEAQERYDEAEFKEQERYDEAGFKEQERYDEQQFIAAQDRSTEQSRYSDQQASESNRIKRENWDFMYEGAENDATRHAIYKDGLTHAVPGLTPGGLETLNTAKLEEGRLELMLDKYNQGSPDYKNQHGPALISALIKNNKPVLFDTISKDYKEIKSEVQNAELIGFISSAYPDVITEQTRSFITQAGVLSDKQLDMVKSMIEANLETRKYSAERKADLVNSIMTMDPPDDTSSQKVIDTYHNLQALAATMHFELEGRVGKGESKPEPYPKYEDYKTLISEDSSYSQLRSEERKKSIFNQITEANAAEWERMSDPEKKKAGDKILETLMTTEYEPAPTVTSPSGTKISDPAYRGVESLTEKDIELKMKTIMDRKGITTATRKNMLSEKQMEKIRKDAVNELLFEKRRESKKKSKQIAREMSKEEASKRLTEEILYGGGGF